LGPVLSLLHAEMSTARAHVPHRRRVLEVRMTAPEWESAIHWMGSNMDDR